MALSDPTLRLTEASSVSHGTGAWAPSGTIANNSGELLVAKVFASGENDDALEGSSITLAGSVLTWQAVSDGVTTAQSTSSPGYGYGQKYFYAVGNGGAAESLSIDAGAFNIHRFAVVVEAYTGHDTSAPFRQVALNTDADGDNAASVTFGAATLSTSVLTGSAYTSLSGSLPSGIGAGSSHTENYELVEASWQMFQSQWRRGYAGTSFDWSDLSEGTGGAQLGASMLAVEIAESAGPTATIEQTAYRFGEDDGSESAHTWAEAENTAIASSVNVTKVLRVQIDATLDPPSKAFRLRYQKNGSGGYVDVPVGTTSTVTINNLPVAAGADDAQQSGSTMTVTGTTVGASLDATTEYVGIRFQNVTIPKGATITAAYLRVVPSGTGEDEPQVTIVGFAEDNTAAFSTTASDITNRAITTASASWSSTDLGATGSSYHNTPSLVSIVQEIVNRTGWASGNAMGFRFQGGSTTTRDLTIESFENTGANPPQLYVEYTVPNPVYVVASTNVAAGGEATTARLTAPSGKTTGDFVTGRRWDDENGTDTLDLTTDDYTELEWVLRVQAPAADGDYFDFRVYDGTNALAAYDVTPRWNVGTPPVANLVTLSRRPPTIFRRH